MPASCQALEIEPSTPQDAMCPLLMSQTSTSPVLALRHSTSVEPSPLKSPTPSACNVDEAVPTAPPPVTRPLVISQVSTSPVVVLRHRASVVPSLLKSPAPTN